MQMYKKTQEKFFFAILEDSEEKANIRVRIRNPGVRIRGSGSVLNRHNRIPVLGKEENINYDSTRV